MTTEQTPPTSGRRLSKRNTDPSVLPCSLIPLVEARESKHESVTIYHTAQVRHKGVNPFTEHEQDLQHCRYMPWCLGGHLGIWSGILARPETATIRIGILDAQLLPIEQPNLLGSQGSWGWVSGLRSLMVICPHLLPSLGPGALIGREIFPIWKGTVGKSCMLNHGCEM